MNSWLECFLVLLLSYGKLSASAQSNKISDAMAKFFEGNWTGQGQFSNGKKVEAEVTFYLSVDSTSLINMYSDRLPNRYKAASDWHADVAGEKFVAHIINNFTALKDFASDGWHDGKTILANQQDFKGKGTLYQRFITKRSTMTILR